MIEQLETYLYEHIPIAKALGVHVEHFCSQKVVLSAPLANNINHKQTVFGGSLHAVATLACWSLLYVNLRKENVHIVIVKSNVAYHAPVDIDFQVECLTPEPAAWGRFMKMLHAKGKARIDLAAQIHLKDRLCVDYHGVFAAIRVLPCS